MEELEIEYKTLLSRQDFDRIKTRFFQEPAVSQTNHYIDTPDFALKNQQMGLRIRTFAEKAELTLKVLQTIGNQEYTQVLPLADATQLLTHFRLPDGSAKTQLLARGINLTQLRVFGSLTTLRREIKTKIGLLALDENHYANTIDYELELEVTDANQGKEDFEHFLTINQIPFQYAPNKIARFSATLTPKEP